MNGKSSLAAYGLKWNPFISSIPIDGLYIDTSLENFCWRVENLVMDGGFAMITGNVGTGKSVALRWIAHKLSGLEDVQVEELVRPQSNLADFYRELGDLFKMPLQVSNRFGSYKALRDRWKRHIESTHFRPILLIDEAQEMLTPVLSELRLMSARKYDSDSIITVILCGDERLPEKFRAPDLVPLGSRIKVRYHTEQYNKEKFADILKGLTRKAGNPALMTEQLIEVLAEKSMGNYRALIQMAGSILTEGVRKEVNQLDERLFFELFDPTRKEI